MSHLPDPNRPAHAPKRFLPYRPYSLEPTLPLEVRSVVVDDQDETDAVLDSVRCRVRPHVVGDWETIDVDLGTRDLRAEVASLAGLEGGYESVALLGKLSCADTRLRRVIRLRPDGRSLVGSFEVDKSEVRDKVVVQLLAVCERPPDTRVRDVAHHRGSLLAVSPQWVVEVRDMAMPASGAFDVAYVDFTVAVPTGIYRGEDANELRAAPDAMSHVAFRPEGPLLLINEHHPDLRAVLFSKGTRGWRARLRDLLAPRIATTVWRAVLVEAWQQLRPAGGFPSPDDRSWAVFDENHWTTRALARAATLRTKKEEEPIPALLDLIEDEESRAGILTGLAEQLASQTERPLPRLVEELDGK